MEVLVDWNFFVFVHAEAQFKGPFEEVCEHFEVNDLSIVVWQEVDDGFRRFVAAVVLVATRKLLHVQVEGRDDLLDSDFGQLNGVKSGQEDLLIIEFLDHSHEIRED